MARDYSKERRRVRTVRVAIDDVDKAVRQTLTMYAVEVTAAIDAAGEEMVKELVKKTKASAPELGGQFKKNIAAKKIQRPSGNLYIWHVKAPFHRLTHLLVHGHANVDGGRTPGSPFLHDALDEVLPEYERKVKEAIRNG